MGAWQDIVGPAGPFFPERAERFGVSGDAQIECKLGANLSLDACVLISESPKQQGFAEAALLMARRRAITYSQSNPAPQPAVGDTVRVDVPFKLPSDHRIP
jgi:protein TonB